MARDLNPDTIPSNLTLGGIGVSPGSAAGAFAAHFSEKVKSNVSKAKIDADGVYNGKCCFLYANNYVPAVPYQKGMSPCWMKQ